MTNPLHQCGHFGKGTSINLLLSVSFSVLAYKHILTHWRKDFWSSYKFILIYIRCLLQLLQQGHWKRTTWKWRTKKTGGRKSDALMMDFVKSPVSLSLVFLIPIFLEECRLFSSLSLSCPLRTMRHFVHFQSPNSTKFEDCIICRLRGVRQV